MNTNKSFRVIMVLWLLIGSATSVAFAQDPLSKLTPVEAAYCLERFSNEVPAESSPSASPSLKDSAAAVYQSCDSEAVRFEELRDQHYTFRTDGL